VLLCRHSVLQHHTSMGRLTLNVLPSFAQFEREVMGERGERQDRRLQAKGLWMGGPRCRWATSNIGQKFGDCSAGKPRSSGGYSNDTSNWAPFSLAERTTCL